MRRRQISEEERALFKQAFAETRPLKNAAKSDPKGVPAAKRGAPGGGLDGNTNERLRKGALEPDARIDLHGFTEAAAHRALLNFLRNAHRSDARLVLVVTGKGARDAAADEPFDMERQSRARGVLKSMVPRWLGERSFAELIADARPAHRRHGGAGAMYVYLRKRRR